MQRTLHDREILDAIRDLSAAGATGELQITAGMTEGGVYFDKGQIVDARLGKLSGFQAINAIAGIPDGNFDFDPSISPPVQSLNPNERMLLNDFFGINVHREPEYFPAGDVPSDTAVQVVPLSDVEQRDDAHVIGAQPAIDHTPHFENQQMPLVDAGFDATHRSSAESTHSRQYSNGGVSNRENPDEVTLIRPNEHRPAISYEPVSRRRFRPTLVAAVLGILIGVVAAALIYRSREHSSTTPPAAQTQSPTDVPSATQTPRATSEVASSAPDLTGNWKVVNTVEQTSYQPYKNLEVGFELAINQTGNEFTGTGQKVSENGRSLTGDSRTPIDVKGSIDGDKVEATFSERGAMRKTSGRFVWRIDKASGGLNGTFSTTAARSSGRSAATKAF